MRTILPGRPQSSRQALASISWTDGLRLVAYISGNSIVIFNGRREILQSILVDDAESLHCLTIDEKSAHIAVSSSNTVYLYKPFGRDHGDLRWTRTSTLPHETEDSIKCLSWGVEDELLVAGDRLALWDLANERKPRVIWASNTSSPVSIACFSPDAGLVASCGQYDRMVKVWRRLSYEQDSTRFDVSYLPHPSAVTNVSWRSFWHQEQSLDNLLYTFCADNHVRVWAHSEQHAFSIMQQIITIDTSVSIQPRRLSVGSVSKNRFAFMLESRDLARAAERALQTHRNGTDHALENFIQIANRSPEICVILDGLGHMSAWGIENAALRNRQDPEKFNVALVDGVDIPLPSGRSLDDHVQIHAFANNDASASLCILVHSYSGQVDWYQGSFVEFFDTAAKTNRTNLLSCWSGHDAPLEKLVSSQDGRAFISLDEQEQAVLWAKSSTGALVRQSRMRSDDPMIDVAILNGGSLVVVLHAESLSIWDMRNLAARKIGDCRIGRGDASAICHVGRGITSSNKVELAVLLENSKVEMYSVFTPDSRKLEVNSRQEIATRTHTIDMVDVGKDDTNVFCHPSEKRGHIGNVVSLSDTGSIKIFDTENFKSAQPWKAGSSLATNLRTSNIVASFNGKVHAIAHEDYRTVSIWNSVQGTCEYVRTFHELDFVHELRWHSTQGGQLMLAVQFPYNVAVLAETRYNIDGSAWELLQTIRTRRHTSIPINSICWLQPCELVLGAGSQILTFLVQSEVDTSDNLEGAPRGSSADTPKYLRLKTSSLPPFDPDLLSDLLESGQFSTASSIFRALHRELKFLVPGEEIEHEWTESLVGTAVSDASTKSSDGISHQSATDSRADDADLTDIQTQLHDSILKVSQAQLSLAQQGHLQSLTQIYLQLAENRGSMDSHALTYLYHFLSAMSEIDPSNLELRALPLSAIVHASLSKTQESLTYLILQRLERQNIKFTWQNARSLGIFMFTTDTEAVKVHLESVAKAEYNRNADDRNPADCSLYYLALDKKAVLQLLWRRTTGVKEKENTLKLLARDFKDPKAKATALKNAYALLSRRRFEYAAAFFLLGGSLIDAVNVCINQLHDIQLAIAITRAWSGNASDQDRVMRKIVEKDLLAAAVDSYEARWWGIWGCIHQEDIPSAIRYITNPVDVSFQSQFLASRKVESEEERKRNALFAAYDHRVNQPGLLITLYTKLRADLVKEKKWTKESLLLQDEWGFVMRCVDWYTRAGMDLLALKLVSHWQFVEVQETVRLASVEQDREPAVVEQNQKSALDEWLVPDGRGDASEKEKEELREKTVKAKPPPTQFFEPSADSLLDSFGF